MNAESPSQAAGILSAERTLSLSEPLPTDCEIRSMTSRGTARLVVECGDGLRLSADDESHLDFVRFLRDCAAWGVGVSWSGIHDSAYPLQDLSHLPPPEKTEPTRAAWPREPRFGRLLWRNGPGFVLIKDARRSEDAARFTLEDDVGLRVFFACQEPRELEVVATTDGERQALSTLIEERLVMRAGERVVSLAVRARRWPIPYMSV